MFEEINIMKNVIPTIHLNYNHDKYDLEKLDLENKQRIAGSDKKLIYTEDCLRSAIEDSELSKQELQSANNELQILNEELKNLNEEYQTTINELSALNLQYEQNIQELTTLRGRGTVFTNHKYFYCIKKSAHLQKFCFFLLI